MIRYSSPKPWLLAIVISIVLWAGVITFVLWLAEVLE